MKMSDEVAGVFFSLGIGLMWLAPLDLVWSVVRYLKTGDFYFQSPAMFLGTANLDWIGLNQLINQAAQTPLFVVIFLLGLFITTFPMWFE